MIIFLQILKIGVIREWDVSEKVFTALHMKTKMFSTMQIFTSFYQLKSGILNMRGKKHH